MNQFFKVGLIQAPGIAIKAANTYSPAYNKIKLIQWIYSLISNKYKNDIPNFDLIILPEMWNTPLNYKYFETYAEKISINTSINQSFLNKELTDQITTKFAEILEFNSPEDSLIELEKLFEKYNLHYTNFNKTKSANKQYIENLDNDPLSINCISTFSLSCLARIFNTFFLGGSIAERRQDGKISNTAPIFSPEGSLVYCYTKTHMFDIDIPGEITFFESENIEAGNKLGIFNHPKTKIGVGICRDLRYGELAILMKKFGASILAYPGCFSSYTGALHWEILVKARAVDTNCFVIGCSGIPPEDGTSQDYQSYGHTIAVSPNGKKLLDMEKNTGMSTAIFDLTEVEKCDKFVPVFNSRRNDLYQINTDPSFVKDLN